VKSNLTDWCFQNLSKRALNALTVQASTTELGKLFQIFTMRALRLRDRRSTTVLRHQPEYRLRSATELAPSLEEEERRRRDLRRGLTEFHSSLRTQ